MPRKQFEYKNNFWKYAGPVIESIENTLHIMFYTQDVADAEGTFGRETSMNDYFIKKGIKSIIISHSIP